MDGFSGVDHNILSRMWYITLSENNWDFSWKIGQIKNSARGSLFVQIVWTYLKKMEESSRLISFYNRYDSLITTLVIWRKEKVLSVEDGDTTRPIDWRLIAVLVCAQKIIRLRG